MAQQIGNHLQQSIQQLQRTNKPNAISKAKPIDDDRLIQITKIVTEVELVKQITLSQDQKSALVMELYRMEMPIERLRTQADIVKRSETYGKLSLEWWMKDLPVFTSFEIKKLVSKEIEKRRTHTIDSGLSEARLHELALSDVIFEAQTAMYHALDKKKDDLRAEVKEISQTFRILDAKSQRLFLKAANDKGLLLKDEHWKESMRYAIPQILTESRNIIARLKEEGKLK